VYSQRASTILRLTLAALAATLIGGGCGTNAEKTTTVTVSRSAQEGQGVADAGSSTKTTPAEPLVHKRPQSIAKRAESLVEDYYANVDDKRFMAAWSLLASGLQSHLGGFATWQGGYAFTTSTHLLRADGTRTSPTAASVAIALAATDRDACGDEVPQTFDGTWMVETEGGQLRGTAFDVEKVAGATPVRDASACGATPSNCDPNYSGACLDPTSSDYDCVGGDGDGPDYTGPVTVVGDDHFQLDDGDGDPRACEPVQ